MTGVLTAAVAPASLTTRNVAAVASAAIIVGLATALLGPALPLYAVAALACAWVAYFAPGVLFAAYFAIPFFKGALQPFSPVDLTVLIAALNAAQVVFVIGGRRTATRRAGLGAWIVMAALVVVGCVYAADAAAATSIAVEWTLLVALPMVAAIRVASDLRRVDQFVMSILACGLFFTVAGAITLAGGLTSRLVVLDLNTINMARAALFVPVVGVAFVGADRFRLARNIAFVVAPVSILVAIASGSRGPVIVGMIVIAVGGTWVLTRQRAVRWRTAVVGGLAVSVLIIAAVATQLVPTQALSRFDSLAAFITDSGAAADSTALQRQSLYQLALRETWRSPLIGSGTGGFATAAATDPALSRYSYPHNLVLEFGANYGLLGLTVLIALVLVAIRGGMPSDPSWRAVALLFGFAFLNGLVSGGMYDDRAVWASLVLMSLRPLASATASRTQVEPEEAAPSREHLPEPPGDVARSRHDEGTY